MLNFRRKQVKLLFEMKTWCVAVALMDCNAAYRVPLESQETSSGEIRYYQYDLRSGHL